MTRRREPTSTAASWPEVPRALVIGDRPNLADGTSDDYESLRIRSGEPRWGAELSEATIPHESGLVDVSVDFDKGCFLGQELVARIDSRGASTPRQVRWIELEGSAEPGADVSLGGSEVGTLTSVADGLGMGLVHRSVEPGQTVQVNGTTGIVLEIPRKPQT